MARYANDKVSAQQIIQNDGSGLNKFIITLFYYCYYKVLLIGFFLFVFIFFSVAHEMSDTCLINE